MNKLIALLIPFMSFASVSAMPLYMKEDRSVPAQQFNYLETLTFGNISQTEEGISFTYNLTDSTYRVAYFELINAKTNARADKTTSDKLTFKEYGYGNQYFIRAVLEKVGVTNSVYSYAKSETFDTSKLDSKYELVNNLVYNIGFTKVRLSSEPGYLDDVFTMKSLTVKQNGKVVNDCVIASDFDNITNLKPNSEYEVEFILSKYGKEFTYKEKFKTLNPNLYEGNLHFYYHNGNHTHFTFDGDKKITYVEDFKVFEGDTPYSHFSYDKGDHPEEFEILNMKPGVTYRLVLDYDLVNDYERYPMQCEFEYTPGEEKTTPVPENFYLELYSYQDGSIDTFLLGDDTYIEKIEVLLDGKVIKTCNPTKEDNESYRKYEIKDLELYKFYQFRYTGYYQVEGGKKADLVYTSLPHYHACTMDPNFTIRDSYIDGKIRYHIIPDFIKGLDYEVHSLKLYDYNDNCVFTSKELMGTFTNATLNGYRWEIEYSYTDQYYSRHDHVKYELQKKSKNNELETRFDFFTVDNIFECYANVQFYSPGYVDMKLFNPEFTLKVYRNGVEVEPKSVDYVNSSYAHVFSYDRKSSYKGVLNYSYTDYITGERITKEITKTI